LLTSEQKKILIFDEYEMAAAGKKLAGRNLDGRTWDQLPQSA
jgi:protein gp37